MHAATYDQYVTDSAVVFIWTAIPYRTEWRYTFISPKIIALDAGHLCQNLYLASEAIGAGTCAIGAYDQEALEAIVRRAAKVLDVDVDEEGATEIARRGRGTPRVALRLLKRVRDYAQVRTDGSINQQVAAEALELLEVDELGLDVLDRQVLTTIIVKFGGGPVGLETIAAAVSEEPDTVMDVVEPYLLQMGFLERTPRGRVATVRACEHLGISCERAEQPTLF